MEVELDDPGGSTHSQQKNASISQENDLNLDEIKTEINEESNRDDATPDNIDSSAEDDVRIEGTMSKRGPLVSTSSTQNVDIFELLGSKDQIAAKISRSNKKTIRIVGCRNREKLADTRKREDVTGGGGIENDGLIGIKFEIRELSDDGQLEINGTERKYKCNFCNKTFLKLSNLSRHERIHTGEKPFSCCACSKRFSRPCTLMVHMRSHTGEKPYQCGRCQKQFTTSCKLTIHSRIHTGEKPYSCSDCHRKFTESSALISHRRTHSGERPFQCNECLKTFAHTSSLVKHFSTHIKKKQRICNLCFDKFADQDELENHRKRVGQWNCEQCNRVFYSKCSLGQHSQKHARDKFKCDRCEERFSNASSLACHMSKHYVTWGDFSF